MLQQLFNKIYRLDWFVILAVFCLLAVGSLAIYSVELSLDVPFFFLRKQYLALLIGIIISLFILRSHYSMWRHLSRGLYLLAIFLLIFVLVKAELTGGVRGTARWISFMGFSFQPVELMKFAFIVQMAKYFSEKALIQIGWREVFQSASLLAPPFLLVVLQPDLGSALFLSGIWFLMLVFAGLRIHYIAIISGLASFFAIIGWNFVLRDYQKNRVLAFLDPTLDPLGIGYNMRQATIAIGSGQLLGRGLGFGSQSQLRFLPEAQTDFIFAVIAEELGFLGAMFICLCFALLIWRTGIIALRARDGFGAFLAIGIGIAFFLQAFINIGVNLSIMPATGIPLPFVSYGGSSILLSIVLIGVLQSVAIKQDPSDISK
jgi:rod shape-determining protein RodA